MPIQKLNQGDLSAGSQIPFYDSAVGGDARASITALAEVLAELMSLPGMMMTQYSSPSASGFSVTVAPLVQGMNVWLLMNPLGSYAAGTIVMPEVSTLNDGQEFQFTTTQAVTTLTLNGNGSTLVGGPTTLVAGGFFRMKFDLITRTLYRIA